MKALPTLLACGVLAIGVAPFGAARADLLAEALPGVVWPTGEYKEIRALPPEVNFYPGWQDSSFAALVGPDHHLRIWFAYWREDGEWFKTANKVPKVQRWVQDCIDKKLPATDRVACLKANPKQQCIDEWIDTCMDRCAVAPDCARPARGPVRANKDPNKFNTYVVDLEGDRWSEVRPEDSLNLAKGHHASAAPLVIGGEPLWMAVTRGPGSNIWLAGREGAGWAKGSPAPYPVSTACEEDEATLVPQDKDTVRIFFSSTRDPKKATWRDRADCDGVFRVWQADLRGGEAIDLKRTPLPPGDGELRKHPWASPDQREFWWTGTDSDCRQDGVRSIACLYRAELRDGVYVNKTLMAIPRPMSLAKDGEVVGLAECNPIPVPQVGEEWLVCSAWRKRDRAPRRQFSIVVARKRAGPIVVAGAGAPPMKIAPPKAAPAPGADVPKGYRPAGR
ncbi:MAG: hypothetical protein KC466_11235 [Myxococcales bacterium]|nr:hypothetical protein [Myxococcales bacterium]